MSSSSFETNGYVVLGDWLSHPPAILSRLSNLFNGDFPTGVYPDEWHWRKGISREGATKEIVNAWKADVEIAKLVFDVKLAKTVQELTGWESVRIAQDDVILKPPLGSAVGPHRDSTYIGDQFERPTDGKPVSITAWIPFDEVDEENGTLLFVPGSHLWRDTSLPREAAFHVEDGFDPKVALQAWLEERKSKFVPVNLKPGDVSFHHEDLVHCSGPNKSLTRHRRIVAVHFLRGDAKFKAKGVGYIYGRYKLWNSQQVLEEFFPTVYPRSAFVKAYVGDEQNQNDSRL